MLSFLDGNVKLPRGEEEQALDKGRTVPAPTVHQWTRVDGGCRKVVWRLWGENALRGGDGTVPLASLLGFAGKARVAPPITDGHNRAHADTPKEGSIWLLIMRSLQGTWAPPPITGVAALKAINQSEAP
jgi:hypothetical protein